MIRLRSNGHIDKNMRKPLQDTVHQPLEGLAHVTQAERYLQEFPQANWCCYSCFVCVLWKHWHLRVSIDQINLRKYLNPCQSCSEIKNEQDRGPIWD